MKYTSLHTHSTFSDGSSTMEEQVLSAIEKGFASVGFSDHSYTDFDLSYCMKKEQIPHYRESILQLREKYKDQIEILMGLELDGYSDIPTEKYDYLIGSVHYVRTDDGLYHPVDSNKEGMVTMTEKYFGGDYNAMAKKYLIDSVQCAIDHKPDFIGHVDLATKYCLVDETEPAYRKVLLECIAAMLEVCPIFEINTGAIARGYRTTPYPADFAMRYINEHGGKFVLNSDCHVAKYLDCFYPESVELAKSCGVKSLVRLTSNGWIEEGI